MIDCGTLCPLTDTLGRNRGKEPDSPESGIHQIADFALDDLNGTVAVDDPHTVRLSGRNLAVLVVNPPVESSVLALESTFILACGSVAMVAAAGAGERFVEVGKQQQGQIGLQPGAHGLVHPQHNLAAQLAAAALVSLGRIGETVAEDNVSSVKGGGDDFGNALGAIGKHETQLGHRVQVLRFGVEEQTADSIS